MKSTWPLCACMVLQCGQAPQMMSQPEPAEAPSKLGASSLATSGMCS